MHSAILFAFFAFLARFANSVDSSNPNLPSGCVQACNCQADCNVCYQGNLTVLCLKGTHYEMGQYYGAILQTELRAVLELLKDNYINVRNASWPFMVEKAQLFANRYSYTFDLFLQGIINGSGMATEEVQVVNAASPLLGDVETAFMCLFGFVPPVRSQTGQAYALRNFDLDPPFDQISKYLVLTILIEDNLIPTAFLSMAGEIYCQTCWNQRGLFMELNNGMPTGGFPRDLQRQDLLVNMLYIMQNSPDLERLSNQLLATASDFSLIISTANQTTGRSFEFSSYVGVLNQTFNWGTLAMYPNASDFYVATNFFLNDAWYEQPYCDVGPGQPPCTWLPTDNGTWNGVSRRSNMLNLLNEVNKHNATTLKTIMDVSLVSGGAKWDATVYQVVYDAAAFQFHIRRTKHDADWTVVDMHDFFSQMTDTTATGSTTLKGSALPLTDTTATGSTTPNGSAIPRLFTQAKMFIMFSVCMLAVYLSQ